MTNAARRFGDTVLANFSPGSTELRASAHYGSAVGSAVGHPMFVDLRIGESRSCSMASVFLDLTNFTGRTFWDDPDDVTALAHSVLSGFAEVVVDLGGHVLGLRGDGLLAGFGPTSDPSISVAVAALACATALDAVQNDLNPRLKSRGIDPVQARAGADFGHTTFVRSGTPEASEVNVIGFATNFAAKCEKAAASWELVVGEAFAEHIPDTSLLEAHPKSPKPYTRNYQTKTYSFSKYRWQKMLTWTDSAIDEIQRRPLEALVS